MTTTSENNQKPKFVYKVVSVKDDRFFTVYGLVDSKDVRHKVEYKLNKKTCGFKGSPGPFIFTDYYSAKDFAFDLFIPNKVAILKCKYTGRIIEFSAKLNQSMPGSFEKLKLFSEKGIKRERFFQCLDTFASLLYCYDSYHGSYIHHFAPTNAATVTSVTPIEVIKPLQYGE